MAALTDLSALVNRVTGGNNGNPQHLHNWIDGRVGAAVANTPVANRWTSLWRYNKAMGGGGDIPSTAENPARNAAGAYAQVDPTGGRQLWLLGVEGFSTVAGNFVLYDRLAHMGGLSGVITTAQTVGVSSVRYNDAVTSVGVHIAVEIYTTIGSTGTTITASYTNQNGVSGRTTSAVAIGGTGLREGERMLILPLQAGDTGVLSVQSVTLAGTTGTAGNFGITLIKPLVNFSSSYAGGSFIRDCVANAPALPEIKSGASLGLMWLPYQATVPQMMIGLHMVEA